MGPYGALKSSGKAQWSRPSTFCPNESPFEKCCLTPIELPTIRRSFRRTSHSIGAEMGYALGRLERFDPRRWSRLAFAASGVRPVSLGSVPISHGAFYPDGILSAVRRNP